MEPEGNPNPLQQNQQINPTPPEVKSGKLKWVFIVILVIFLLAVVGFGGYYLGVNKQTINTSSEISPTPESSNVVSPTPSKTVNIPDGWTLETSTLCKVTLPLPPKKEPYYIPKTNNSTPTTPVTDDGGYWIFEENSSGDMFKNSAIAIFRNPDLGGSEYVAGGVFVSCNPNTQKLTTDILTDEYIKKYVTSSDVLKATNRETVNLFGKKISALTIQGGMYPENADPIYFYANENIIYQISKASMSTNNTIKQTTETIFNNLRFEE